MLLRGRLSEVWEEKGVASAAGGEEGRNPSYGGISGLKVVFSFPLPEEEDIVRCCGGLLPL